MAIEKGNVYAMFNIGDYYETIEKNYDEAEKYYIMAIEKCNDKSMNNLGLYYETIEKKYNKAKIAIKKKQLKKNN